jgi:hypothetical protein
MRLSGSRFALGVTALMVSAASVVFAIGGGDHAVAGAASTSTGVTAGPTQIVVQTMDSCRSGLEGAVYELLDGGGHVVQTAGAKTATNSPGSVPGGGTCVVQQGDCVHTSKGCVVFPAVAPGVYRLRETWTPVRSNTNPDGYAPCNSGSACHWQTADVTVTGNGILGQVTNVAPSGQVQHFPSDPTHATYFAGTPADPIVFHDFGLCKPGSCPAQPVPPATVGAPNTCDGDNDADDWITGSKSSQCGFQPEGSEATGCTPTFFNQNPNWNGVCFPWQLETNTAAPMLLQQVTLSGPSSVAPFSSFQVNVSNGSTPTLVSAQDPGMRVTPNGAGFSVALSPVRKSAGGAVTTGTVTISPQGGQGNSLVISVGMPTTNGNFIENLYHDVLGRYGLPDEVAYWSSRMDSGMLGWQMAQVFSTTPEFLGRMVDSDYRSMVGSAPAANDPGRAFWVGQLTSGRSNDVIMGSLGASPSYYAQAGGTDSGFITSLYSKVLHRAVAPGAAEIQYWVGNFGPFASNQAARLQVANDMAFSHEQHMYVAGTWYQTFLGRGPDSSGQSFWADQMDNGVLQQVGVSSFTNTAEYFNQPAKY